MKELMGLLFEAVDNAAGSTAPAAAPAEVKQTIPQKVEVLLARKTAAIAEMNAEGIADAAKVALQEEINVIDRKVRWYAGRSGGKKETTARPSKAATPKASRRKAAVTVEPAPTTAPAPSVDPNAS